MIKFSKQDIEEKLSISFEAIYDYTNYLCDVTHEAVKCTLYSDSRRHFDELKELLYPYFKFQRKNKKNNLKIYMVENNQIHSDLFDFSECTLFDILKHTNKQKEIKAYTIKCQDHKIFYIIKTNDIIIIENQRITIVGNPNNLVYATVLVIRDLSYVNLIMDGYVQLHASAVVDNNSKVTLFIGKSNSGKTTSLLHTLKNRNSSLLSNGRVFAKYIQNRIVIIGTPENIGLRIGTLQHFREFNDIYTEGVQEIKIGYNKLCSIFNCNVKSNGILHNIVITNFNCTDNNLCTKAFILQTLKEEINNYDKIKRREWVMFDAVNSSGYNDNAEQIFDFMIGFKHIDMMVLKNNECAKFNLNCQAVD